MRKILIAFSAIVIGTMVARAQLNPGGGGGGGGGSAPTNVTPTDCSGTIGTGGTAQNAIAAQTTLHGFTIVWRATAEPGWMSFTGTAAPNAAGSYPLTAPTASTFAGAGSFTTPYGFGTNHAVSIYGATTGDAYSCTGW